jgi:hypothetical protein
MPRGEFLTYTEAGRRWRRVARMRLRWNWPVKKIAFVLKMPITTVHHVLRAGPPTKKPASPRFRSRKPIASL